MDPTALGAVMEDSHTTLVPVLYILVRRFGPH